MDPSRAWTSVARESEKAATPVISQRIEDENKAANMEVGQKVHKT